jgi:hypothetical protein
MFAIKNLSFVDFKFHLNPDADEIKLRVEAERAIKVPESGEKNRFLILMNIDCVGNEVEDFYLKIKVLCEISSDKDVEQDEIEEKLEEYMPTIADLIYERANKIATEMNVPEFSFLRNNLI